jgi:hypothetical protein
VVFARTLADFGAIICAATSKGVLVGPEIPSPTATTSFNNPERKIMKTLRKILAATVLTCVFSLAAMAGEIGTGVAQAPPPPSVTGEISTGSSATAETNLTGDMGTGASATVDPVTEIALSLLESLLALF